MLCRPYVKRSMYCGGIFVATFLMFVTLCYGKEGTASWYSVESCIKESGQCTMANGEVLNDNDYICASWDYRFGTILDVTNVDTGRTVTVTVKDRGPAKRLYNRGRIIDLSKAAFSQIANLRQGIIRVSVVER